MSREHPRGTVRLQLHAGFTFDDAAAIVPQLARLGVSHVYTSPVLQAKPGSNHGYDVVDHGVVNEELGGEAARARFCDVVQQHGMAWLLDIVPNHMAIGDRRNAWWWDVLENGPSSPYALHFDIDWSSPEKKNRNVVLAPILGDHRGRVLERREIKVVREGDAFLVRYFDNVMPLAPRTHDVILAAASRAPGLADHEREELEFLADAHSDLPLATSKDRQLVRRRHRDKKVLRIVLADLVAKSPAVAAAIEAALATVNDDPAALDALLERQNYRLAHWRTAEHELGYRRFFDVNHLVGLRAEDEVVFQESHRLVLDWARRGVLDGVRVDHVDGLADPAGYLARLRAHLPDAWIVVEKILCEGEELRPSWPIDGTTGYDFLAQVNGLFVDPAGELPLTSLETRFTGETRSFPELAREKKLTMLREVLDSDASRLTQLLAQICDGRRDMRDQTRPTLHAALCEVLASFSVYRTYVTGRAADEDRGIIARACADARTRRPELDPTIWPFLEDVLVGGVDDDDARELRVRFQQLSGPVMAKGVEDTSFYCAHRLVSLNEVGGHPSQFGTSPADLHRENALAHERWPRRLLATSTHDTKRSEDVRTRISVLSEMPAEWAALVEQLAGIGARHKTSGMPDRAFELFTFQTLVGAWPLSVERACAYVEKAAREAKVHTSWIHNNKEYEQALVGWVKGIMTDGDFVRVLETFLAPLLPAARVSSLSQTLVKMTSPGVPDIYQGCDLWDESLVDPDNRRPVDWGLRARALELVGGPSVTPEAVLARSAEGLPKLHVIHQALQLRERRKECFAAGAEGRYEPLVAQGPQAERCFAFARGGGVVTVAPRLTWGLARAGGFGTTTLALPAGAWRNVLTGDAVAGGKVRIADLVARFPVALLERTDAASTAPFSRRQS